MAETPFPLEGLGEMAEDKEPRRISISVDGIIKVLPWVIIILQFVSTYSKKDASLDTVVQQLAKQETVIASMSNKIGDLSDRISKIEGSQESLRREVRDQDTYRDHK